MKAMVLAAGLGTRLRPLTLRIPKPLVPVAGRPLIAYPLLQLGAAGVRDVVVNAYHLADRVRAELGDGSSFGVRLHISEEDELLETGGGIERAGRWLRGENFFLLNADSIHDVPLRDLLEFHRAHGGIATLVLRSDTRAAHYGLIEIDAAHRMRRFLGRPEHVEGSLTPLMFAGVSVFDPRVFDYMSPGRFSLTRETIPRLMQAGEALFGYRYDGYWQVVDTPADLDAARRALEGGQRLSYLRARQSRST